MKVAAVQVSFEKCNAQITLGCAVIRRIRVYTVCPRCGANTCSHMYIWVILYYYTLN